MGDPSIVAVFYSTGGGLGHARAAKVGTTVLRAYRFVGFTTRTDSPSLVWAKAAAYVQLAVSRMWACP